MKTFLTIFLVFCTLFPLHNEQNEDDWNLIENTEKMKIYTRLPEGSKYKEVKMELIVEAEPLEILRFISIADKFTDWVYSCTESYVVTHKDFQDAYYIRFDMVWPIMDRDLVQSSNTRIDPSTGIIDIHTRAVEGYVPKIDNVVRIKENNIYWKLIPQGPGKTHIDYHVINNPGGKVPSWLMNMVATFGPKNSMSKMIECVEKK
jgi:hypothetical protein